MRFSGPLLVLSVLICGPGYAARDPYGLLFTTPGERAQLDSRFAAGGGDDQASAAPVAEESRAPRPLKLNGTLTSSAGKKEAWINGELQLSTGSKQTARIRVLDSDRVQVRASLSGAVRNMKPGQVLDPETGKISEAYAGAAGP